MAIFNSINKYSKAVGIFIAIVLVLFLLSDFLVGQNSLFSGNDNNIGKINGEKISAEEYRRELDKVLGDYAIRTDGQTPSETQMPYYQDLAWENLIYENAWKDQFKKLGLTVTNEENIDMVQGKNIQPSVRQLFTNPQTQQFDTAFVKEFFRTFEQRPERDQMLWMNEEKRLSEERLKNKYLNLFRKSVYVTSLEAKREHENQTTTVSAKYLFVPYSSIPDSLIKVEDGQLEDYISDHKLDYKVDEGVSLDYVVFNIKPSSKDSVESIKELESLKADFVATKDDTLFVVSNSDAPANPTYKKIADLPKSLMSSNMTIDSVYGPYLENGRAVLYKILGSKADTVYSAKASHILIDARNKSGKEKDSLKQVAKGLLVRAQKGEDFTALAQQYSADTYSPTGTPGDLGWFSEGAMVTAFNDAVFSAKKLGVIANLVETEYGFHIIKMTNLKENTSYHVASIEKTVAPSEDSREVVLRKADDFVVGIEDTADFNAAVKKDTLDKKSAPNLRKEDRNIAGVANGREIVKWAYDAKIDEISKPFLLENQVVVAIVTSKRDKGTAEVEDVRAEVTSKVLQKLKAEQITEKLKGISGDFEKMAGSYGPGAVNGVAPNLTFSMNTIQGIGYETVVIGSVFGLNKGERTGPVAGENGVVIMEVTELVPANEVGDYTKYQNDISKNRSGRVDYSVEQAIKEDADIEDNRIKFY